jgi:hypothetical protein
MFWARPNPKAGCQIPPGQTWLLSYNQRDVAPLVTLSAIFNQNVANNDGKAVNAFRPLPFSEELGDLSFDAALAVRDTDAFLNRVGYQVTAIASLDAVPIIE